MPSRPGACDVTHHDVIVAGVGAVGSAACYHLAARGLDVVGIERHGIPHTMGSSHGITRLHSLTSGRSAAYVAAAERALERWRALEAETGETLFVETGHVRGWPAGDGDGHRGGPADARAALDERGVDYELLDGAAANERWPGYELPPDHRVLYQPDSGFLDPELAISAAARAAADRGAEIRAHERVRDWTADGDGVRVRTDRTTHAADRLVLAVGAWAAEFVDDLAAVSVPERRVMCWFQPDEPADFRPGRFPTFSLDVGEGYCYGSPIHRVPGFKIGDRPAERRTVDPETMPRETTAADEARLRRLVESHFPAGAGPVTRRSACVLTMTPDEGFLVDRHPEHPNVLYTGGFSGSGFHTASAVGELLADLATEASPALDPGPFRLAART